MNIALLTAFTAGQEQAARPVIDQRRAYCQRHAYAFEPARGPLHPDWPARFDVFHHVLAQLTRFDWLLWLDPFSIILDPARRIEHFIEPGADIVLAMDDAGLTLDRLLVRNTPAALRLFRAALRHHPLIRSAWQERAVLMRALQDVPDLRIRQLPQAGFASPAGAPRPGDFLACLPIHPFPGSTPPAEIPANLIAQVSGRMPSPRDLELPPAPATTQTHPRSSPTIVIDGVFFQLYQTGIARVWRSLLEHWVAFGFAEHLLVLDRAGSLPAIPGLRTRPVLAYDDAAPEADRRMLQRLCDDAQADLFISTYCTAPLSTPSVFMVHDMIPELFGWDLCHPMWRDKHYAIRTAAGYACVSDSTRRDLLRFFPHIEPGRITVAPLGAAESFHQRPAAEVDQLRSAAGIRRPYFLTVGARGGYKNTALTFGALAKLPNRREFDLLCAGLTTLEPEFGRLVPDIEVKAFNLTDDQLAAAYSGAVALLHPSAYEGFGLPVLEAMACGCPVITTARGALAEVAGDAALFVEPDDVEGMVRAMQAVQRPEVRQPLIAWGLLRAGRFSWRTTADRVRDGLLRTIGLTGVR